MEIASGWKDWALLHVYGQMSWHGDLIIVGNERGLLALRKAIDLALEHGAGMAGAIQNDGEGYWIEVAKIAEPETNTIPAAYVADYAHNDDAPWPEPVLATLRSLTADKAREWGTGFASAEEERAAAIGENEKKL